MPMKLPTPACLVRLPIYWLLVLCMLYLASPASATVEYALQGGASKHYFDNPYLFGPNTVAPDNSQDGRPRGNTRPSSPAWSTDLGAAVFIPLPSDRSYLLLSGAASKYRFGSLGQLDHTKKQWDGLFQWELGSALRGKLYHRDDERLFGYFDGLKDGRVPQKNDALNTNRELLHIRENQAEIALRLTPRVDIPFTVTRQTLDFTDDYNISPYTRNNRANQLALRYEPGTKSTLLAGVKRTTTRFPLRTQQEQDRYDTGYRDREIFVDAAWRFTENTIFLGRFGNVHRQFDTLHNRNLRAIEVGADWHYSIKTWFTFRLWDRPESIDDSGEKLFLQVRGVQARMMWESTPKTRFAFLTSVEQERYQTFNSNISTINDMINSQSKTLHLGVRFDYDITPRLNLQLEALRRQELSNPDNPHHNGLYRASIRYTFENMTGNNRARIKLDSLR